jgi:hypothetical protein
MGRGMIGARRIKRIVWMDVSAWENWLVIRFDVVTCVHYTHARYNYLLLWVGKPQGQHSRTRLFRSREDCRMFSKVIDDDDDITNGY